jgi:hypothetical protein
MKTKSLILAGVLIIAFAAMVTPVMADLSDTTVITGNPASTTALSITEATLSLGTAGVLAVGDNPGTLTMVVSNNAADGYTVSVQDSMDDSKSGFAGQMLEYDTGTTHYITASPKSIAAAMVVTVPDDATFYTHNSKTLAATAGSALITSASENHMVTDKSITTTATQTVVLSDPHLTDASRIYRIVPLFTITAL